MSVRNGGQIREKLSQAVQENKSQVCVPALRASDSVSSGVPRLWLLSVAWAEIPKWKGLCASAECCCYCL